MNAFLPTPRRWHLRAVVNIQSRHGHLEVAANQPTMFRPVHCLEETKRSVILFLAEISVAKRACVR